MVLSTYVALDVSKVPYKPKAPYQSPREKTKLGIIALIYGQKG